MKNPIEVQDWKTVNKSIINMDETMNIPVEYDATRLAEYKNAILCLFYRIPMPQIYITFNPIKHEYKLINDNSLLEAYVLFKSDLFTVEDEVINGKYSDFEQQHKRRINEAEVTVKVFTYTDTSVLNQVIEIIKKIKS